MPIYLDNNATTPLDPRVLEKVVENLRGDFGNPSSAHSFGQKARQEIQQARRTIASFLGVKPQEIIFNSGGTEGVNTVIRGIPKGHIITSSAEHACVFSAVQEAEKQGSAVTYLSPGAHGAVTAEVVKAALRPDTSLIALMAVNNETGVKTDIEAIAAIAEEAKVPFLVDGVAWLGKELFTLPHGVSAMAFSGHKLHAPKGGGFLVLRSRLRLTPLLFGGGQEYGKRCGTENVPGIIGMAEAIRLLQQELPAATDHMRRLRDRMEQQLLQKIPGALVNGEGPRICNTTNISFAGVDGESLLMALDQAGVAVSHGSACSTGALEPSRILVNMGLPVERARSAMRFSVSRFTTEAEIDAAVAIIVHEVSRLTHH